MSALTTASARRVDSVQVLRDGVVAFPVMLELIEHAQRSILFENFIFAGDATGRRFSQALGRAAKRGVDVRVVYDPLGTLLVSGGSIARFLVRDGVRARPFRPLSPFRPWNWPHIKHRDHRKMVSVDGEVAVVGGFCISDNWAPPSQGGRGWRDTGLLVRGPLVADIDASFEVMWRWEGERRFTHAAGAASDIRLPAALVVPDHPGARHTLALYHWLAEHAQHSLEITDAYLVTPLRLLFAFETAARRGVDVRLLLPGRNNHPIAGAAARGNYQRLLDAGVGIWEWSGAMMHAKTAVVDGKVTLVGSSNLDPLSMRRNYELNVLIADIETGGAMREMFARDLTEATRVDAVEWRHRPAWRRMGEAMASYFSPNL